jgi:hypothetical protein
MFEKQMNHFMPETNRQRIVPSLEGFTADGPAAASGEVLLLQQVCRRVMG